VTKITHHTACQHGAVQYREQKFLSKVCMDVKVTTLDRVY